MNDTERLLCGLRNGKRRFDLKRGSERTAAMEQLGAMLKYSEGVLGNGHPEVIALLKPSRMLMEALFELDRGRTLPILDPHQIANRPRTSARLLRFRAIAAVVMELFHRSGRDIEGAARAAAQAVWPKSGSEGVVWGQVKKWREKAQEQNQRDPLAAFYSMMIDHLEATARARGEVLQGDIALKEAKRISRDMLSLETP